MPEKKADVKDVAKMLEDANKKMRNAHEENILPLNEEMGRCEWIDINGNLNSNSPWTQAQCNAVGGNFTPGG